MDAFAAMADQVRYAIGSIGELSTEMRQVRSTNQRMRCDALGMGQLYDRTFDKTTLGVRKLIDILTDHDRPISAWAVEPKLTDGNAPIYEAFLDLSPSRPAGWGAIPLTEIGAYLRPFWHPRSDDARELIALIWVCDGGFGGMGGEDVMDWAEAACFSKVAAIIATAFAPDDGSVVPIGPCPVGIERCRVADRRPLGRRTCSALSKQHQQNR